MQIVRWRPADGRTNYGDEVGSYLWERLLNKRLGSLLPKAYFYGIGTILCEPKGMPNGTHNVVFGAGMGYHGTPVPQDNWKTYFVRGPRTAKAMGGVPYITDPAILMREFFKKAEKPEHEVSFMPRWDTLTPELPARVAEAGIRLISPCESVEKVTNEIANSGLLLTEALHGAVVADALRVPWISINLQPGHLFKWYDWCHSLNMVWNAIDGRELGLTWARKNAVPQLSALSRLNTAHERIREQLDLLNKDIANGFPGLT